MYLFAKADAKTRQLEESMVRDLERMTALPGLKDFRDSHALPRAFFRAYISILREVDEYNAEVRSQSTHVPSCVRGCTACCHMAPGDVGAAEYIGLYDRFTRSPQKQMMLVQHQANAFHFLRMWKEDVLFSLKLASGISAQSAIISQIESTEDPVELERLLRESERGYSSTQESYFRRNVFPCGFLQEQECAAYGKRPLACRGHTSDAFLLLCEPDRYSIRGKAMVALPKEVLAAIYRVDSILGLNLSPTLPIGFMQLYDLMKGQPIRRTQ
ncbi:MAG: hypothetical protein AABX47_09280 [Nanoarchaeota archaeon]